MKSVETRITDHVGLAEAYTDQFGHVVKLSEESRHAILKALGYDLTDQGVIKSHLDQITSEKTRATPRLVVTIAGRQTTLRAERNARSWRIELEDGGVIEGARTGESLSIPELPIGYHHLIWHNGCRSTIFSSPEKCYVPPDLHDRKAFGVSTQVYSLRRPGDHGIGDIGHVDELVKGCSRYGIDLVGLSPLHAMFPSDRTKVSPYSPSSRFFIDPVFIDVDALSGIGHERALVDSARASRLVNLQDVWARKYAKLRKIWSEEGQQRSADPQFDGFLKEQGSRLQLHATFDSISTYFASQGATFSGAWPSALMKHDSAEVRQYVDLHDNDVRFWTWLQFVADQQLGKAAKAAAQAGMMVGLYRDLAVGADLYGSEIWSNPSAWCPALSVGAPPDPLGPKGQDWGLPPLNPVTQIADGLAEFRALVAANMRYAGAIRIDHAFQLERLFVIPRGMPASAGAYLSYPLDAMLAVLRIESHRANCSVIAEDLGNGPPGFSDKIMNSGIFSYRILSFERDSEGGFKPPTNYPQQSLASMNTHDLPTFAGWWRGLDIDLRECFGIYDANEWKDEKRRRRDERSALQHALHDEGVISGYEASEQETRYATMRFLSRTNSSLAVVSLEDVCAELNQPNIPGLAGGYPNWSRRLNRTVEDILAPGGDLSKCASTVSRDRRSGRPSSIVAQDLPLATYRLQLHANFTLDDATRILPKLAFLGVSHVYVSPITTAMAGSTHGYDVTDPTEINPEIGGAEAFDRFCDALHASDLKLIVDIVPNHMAADPANSWWASILKDGQASPYATFFDIDWDRQQGRVVLPILGMPLANMLAERQVQVVVDGGEVLIDVGQRIPIKTSDAKYIQTFIGGIIKKGETPQEVLDRTINQESSHVGELVARQNWRPVYWRTGRSEINYRRFFEIDSLVGIRVEDDTVFQKTHSLIFDLIDKGKIQGLRIDHIDGLADPKGYLERLQNRIGPGAYVVVEKILGAREQIPDWPVAGTTGYDALVQLDGVFLDASKMPELDAVYVESTNDDSRPNDLLRGLKADLAAGPFAPELTKLIDLGISVCRASARWSDISRDALKAGLIDYLARLPVYRTYLDDGKVTPADHALVDTTLEEVSKHGSIDQYIVGCLRSLLLDPCVDAPRREFRSRIQQLSGPLMAKGQEDTLFYRYHSLVVANEVGGDANEPVPGVSSFHARNAERATRFPGSLIATTTHDTKRGEDGRARLLCLAQHPSLSGTLANIWMSSAERLGFGSLNRIDLFMALQNIVASMPLNRRSDDDYSKRIGQFLEKALREGKARSSWASPDVAYEGQLHDCATAILRDRQFEADSRPIMDLVMQQGAWISLARTVLKCTIPGIPDFYQGTEGWDFSLVDPDNRRPVAFDIDENVRTDFSALMSAWQDARIKQALTKRLLMLRQASPALFSDGSYIPLSSEGDGWTIFRREFRSDHIVVAVRRLFDEAWTGALMPESAYAELEQLGPIGKLENILSDHAPSGGTASSWAEFCHGMPFAVMRLNT